MTRSIFIGFRESRHLSFYGSAVATAAYLANEITNTQPGEIFVHRNIANMVVHTDVNLLSVLEYAVTHLKVKHVIVCGHYGCGGVKAAMTNHDYKQVLNMWLRNIKDVYRLHRDEIESLPEEQARFDRLVELNVRNRFYTWLKPLLYKEPGRMNKGPIFMAGCMV